MAIFTFICPACSHEFTAENHTPEDQQALDDAITDAMNHCPVEAVIAAVDPPSHRGVDWSKVPEVIQPNELRFFHQKWDEKW